ncbi:MAG: SDR family oxidoreductase [Chloroflexi bacterium]|nr:SDR family oxidoreductase [Chloroflexota bacterium]
MKILILGGTIFLGRHLVEAALARGHGVTLFNRGQHNPDLFPQVEKLRGNRDGEMGSLARRQWDAVIDTCGYIPRIVRASAEYLSNATRHYTFISTISVYGEISNPGADEHSPLATLADPTVEQITGETYGPLKVLCEQVAEQALPGRVLQVRPGLIAGPYDPTDRFTYWLHRIAQGGEVLAPGQPHYPVQVIDVRDLSTWTIKMIETGQTGVYNTTGPDYPLTMGELLETSRDVAHSQATFTWVTEEFLRQHQVAPFTELPLWLPQSAHGILTVDSRKAFATGLTCRPLAATAADTLTWDITRPAGEPLRNGLNPEREAELLQKWHSSQ